MNDIRVYKAYPSDLNLHESFRLVGEYFSECGYKERPDACERANIAVALDGSRTLTVRKFQEFLKLLQQHPRPESVSLHSHWKVRGELIRFMMDVKPFGIIASVQSDDPNLVLGIHERVKEIFRASSPTEERSPAAVRIQCKKTVFLAHRFDDAGRATSAKVNTLLRRLGFDVREGEGYETKSIPDKVGERIRSQDILICVVTPGDASWLLSEAAFAKGLGKYIILLLEEGLTFNKGIVGADYEHLQFPAGNVEKVFNDLLYALPY